MKYKNRLFILHTSNMQSIIHKRLILDQSKFVCYFTYTIIFIDSISIIQHVQPNYLKNISDKFTKMLYCFIELSKLIHIVPLLVHNSKEYNIKLLKTQQKLFLSYELCYQMLKLLLNSKHTHLTNIIDGLLFTNIITFCFITPSTTSDHIYYSILVIIVQVMHTLKFSKTTQVITIIVRTIIFLFLHFLLISSRSNPIIEQQNLVDTEQQIYNALQTEKNHKKYSNRIYGICVSVTFTPHIIKNIQLSKVLDFLCQQKNCIQLTNNFNEYSFILACHRNFIHNCLHEVIKIISMVRSFADCLKMQCNFGISFGHAQQVLFNIGKQTVTTWNSDCLKNTIHISQLGFDKILLDIESFKINNQPNSCAQMKKPHFSFQDRDIIQINGKDVIIVTITIFNTITQKISNDFYQQYELNYNQQYAFRNDDMYVQTCKISQNNSFISEDSDYAQSRLLSLTQDENILRSTQFSMCSSMQDIHENNVTEEVENQIHIQSQPNKRLILKYIFYQLYKITKLSIQIKQKFQNNYCYHKVFTLNIFHSITCLFCLTNGLLVLKEQGTFLQKYQFFNFIKVSVFGYQVMLPNWMRTIINISYLLTIMQLLLIPIYIYVYKKQIKQLSNTQNIQQLAEFDKVLNCIRSIIRNIQYFIVIEQYVIMLKIATQANLYNISYVASPTLRLTMNTLVYIVQGITNVITTNPMFISKNILISSLFSIYELLRTYQYNDFLAVSLLIIQSINIIMSVAFFYASVDNINTAAKLNNYIKQQLRTQQQAKSYLDIKTKLLQYVISHPLIEVQLLHQLSVTYQKVHLINYSQCQLGKAEMNYIQFMENYITDYNKVIPIIHFRNSILLSIKLNVMNKSLINIVYQQLLYNFRHWYTINIINDNMYLAIMNQGDNLLQQIENIYVSCFKIITIVSSQDESVNIKLANGQLSGSIVGNENYEFDIFGEAKDQIQSISKIESLNCVVLPQSFYQYYIKLKTQQKIESTIKNETITETEFEFEFLDNGEAVLIHMVSQ